MYKVIEVKFNKSEKSYSYHTDIVGVEEGDKVVVPVSNCGFKLVTVTKTQGISKASLQMASALVVQKLNLPEWELRKEKLSLIQEVKNELRNAKEQQDEITMYALMAETNPVISGLLDKLKELDPSSVPQLT